MKRCFNCKFWATFDGGYSNYTVTETMVHCLKGHFYPVEESYSWEYDNADPNSHSEFFKTAENCPDFNEGQRVHFDVDGDITAEDYIDDPVIYNALKPIFKNRP